MESSVSNEALSPVPVADPAASPRRTKPPTAFSLTGRLAKMIENLDAYINDRAFKMASARIEAADRRADARIAAVEREALIQRQQAERQIAELQRELERARGAVQA